MPYDFTCVHCGKQCIEIRPSISRSYCSRECHYSHTRSIEQASKRFWNRADCSGGSDVCWEWQGGMGEYYGQFSFRGRGIGTHRFAWEAVNGPIPDGMFVCHSCDNRFCVNPSHLFLGTQADNIADKVTKSRQARGAGHGQSKLTENDVREIRLLHGSVPGKAIAARFGISETNVSMIGLGHTWKHVK